MASILKVDTIQDQAGNNIINENANVITIGASGDTITSVGTFTSFTSTGIDDNATSTAITINSSEQVGIGTSSPSQLLHIAAAIPKFRIQDTDVTSQAFDIRGAGADVHFDLDPNNAVSAGDIKFDIDGSNKMIVRSTGNVGIGTTSPTTKLDVVGTGVNGIELGQQSDGTDSSRLFFTNSTNVCAIRSKTGGFVFSTGATVGSSSGDDRITIDYNSGTRLFVGTTSDVSHGVAENNRVIVSGYSGNGAGMIGFQDTSGNTDGTITVSNGSMIITADTENTTASSSLQFRVDNSEKMRIDSSGNVGVGTTSPDHKVTITGSSNQGTLGLYSSGTSNELRFENDGSQNWVISNQTQGLRFKTAGTERMRIDSSGNVGIGTTSPGSYKLSLVDSGSCLVKFRGGSGSGTYQQFEVNNGASTIGYLGDGANLISGGQQTDICLRGTTNIKFAIANFQKTTINSSGLTVHGALSKSSGSFKIDHPLENKKDTHHLVHSFVEAPQADNIYRGKIDLINGTATVNIDTVAGMSEGTFVLLNTNIQCFTSNETGWIAVKGSVSGNTLTITAQDNTCTDTISWMVIGERQDQHMYDTDWTDENGKVIVEPLKETEE